MPKMTHPVTGGSFVCGDRQVQTWLRAGWVVADVQDEEPPPTEPKRRGKSAKTEPSDQAPSGDDTEE